MSYTLLPSPAVSAMYCINNDHISFLDAWGETIEQCVTYPKDYFGHEWDLPIELPDKIHVFSLRLI